MAHDVFLSNSNKDKVAADAVRRALEREGLRVWMTARDILPSADWAEWNRAAINEARVFVLIFSANANRSEHTWRELEYAVSRGKPVIPFWIDNVEPSVRFAQHVAVLRRVDAFPPPIEPHFGRLAAAVKELLEREPVRGKEPPETEAARVAEEDRRASEEAEPTRQREDERRKREQEASVVRQAEEEAQRREAESRRIDALHRSAEELKRAAQPVAASDAEARRPARPLNNQELMRLRWAGGEAYSRQSSAPPTEAPAPYAASPREEPEVPASQIAPPYEVEAPEPYAAAPREEPESSPPQIAPPRAEPAPPPSTRSPRAEPEVAARPPAPPYAAPAPAPPTMSPRAEPASAPTTQIAPASGGQGGPPKALVIVGALLATAGVAYAFHEEIGALVGWLAKSLHLSMAPPGPAPSLRSSEVDVSAFAPNRARRGSRFLVQVFLHAPEAEERTILLLAKAADSEAVRRGVATLDIDVAEGERLDFVLDGEGLVIAEPHQSLVWRGRPRSCAFLVEAPRDFNADAAQLRVRVLKGAAPVGHIRFSVAIDASDARAAIEPAGEAAPRYRRAFLSYASSDRAEVLKRAQALRAAGVDFFNDLLSLEPGERWERRLYEEIDRCDVFLLFWSQAAKESQWVRREIDRARDAARDSGRPAEILPIILEGPPPPTPPESLASLHFNDPLCYVIAAIEKLNALRRAE